MQDVVAIYHSLRNGGTLGRDFFYDEYQVDYAIATMRTPTVALLRGITSMPATSQASTVHHYHHQSSINTISTQQWCCMIELI